MEWPISKETYQDDCKKLANMLATLIPLAGYYTRPPTNAAEYEKWKLPTSKWKDQGLARSKALAALSQGHWLALIPASLNLAVVDVDEGDAAAIPKLLDDMEVAYTVSITRRGAHYAFLTNSSWPKGNWKFEVDTAKGDIRHDKGYVVVWDPRALLDASQFGEELAAGLKVAEALGHKKKERLLARKRPTML